MFSMFILRCSLYTFI